VGLTSKAAAFSDELTDHAMIARQVWDNTANIFMVMQ
jgi:hypothetical protein